MKLWMIGPAIGLYMMLTKKDETKKKPVKKTVAAPKNLHVDTDQDELNDERIYGIH